MVDSTGDSIHLDWHNGKVIIQVVKAGVFKESYRAVSLSEAMEGLPILFCHSVTESTTMCPGEVS